MTVQPAGRSIPEAPPGVVKKQILERRLGDVDVEDVRSGVRGRRDRRGNERPAPVGVEIGPGFAAVGALEAEGRRPSLSRDPASAD
jgi:hypothetical protein